jgi:hypothetical protein
MQRNALYRMGERLSLQHPVRPPASKRQIYNTHATITHAEYAVFVPPRAVSFFFPPLAHRRPQRAGPR